MGRCWPAILVLLAGCDRGWKDRYVKEVNYHYQTQQIKDAEIAARELEIENQKSYNSILEAKVEALEKRVAHLEGSARPAAPALARRIDARVTALANEIDLVVFSAGREDGVSEGMVFWISREGEAVGKAVVDRVDAKWSAAKLKEKKQDPKVGDSATNQASR